MSEPPSSLGRLSYLQGGSGRRLATVKEGGKKMPDIDGENNAWLQKNVLMFKMTRKKFMYL